jgi:hypothetical protein
MAGFVATVPMTIVMHALHHQLPGRDRYRLPPEQITADLAQRAGLARAVGGTDIDALAWTLHFAYGAGAGAVYVGLVPAGILPGWLTGPAYGVAVWAASYFGWLPALGIHGRGDEQPPRRNALMLAAHVVWGSALGRMATPPRPTSIA